MKEVRCASVHEVRSASKQTIVDVPVFRRQTTVQACRRRRSCVQATSLYV